MGRASERARRAPRTKSNLRYLQDREGSTLLLSLLVLAALSILASALIVSAMGDRNLSKYDRASLEALGAAETGVAYAKRAIVNRTASLQDYDGDGRPDFVMSDSLSWGGTYRVIAEASDIEEIGITSYLSNGFTIISEGRFQGAIRRVAVEIAHDSFLKFARFIGIHSLSYECGDVIAGEVYAGSSISLPCGCGGGQEPHFMEKVYATGPIPQADCAIFERGYTENAEPIDLLNSINWDNIRDKVRGLSSDNSCEGMGGAGAVGIYMNLPSVDPLRLGTQAGADQNVLVLDRFDFMNDTLEPPDTVITYGGQPVINSMTGVAMRRGEFNGIVFFEGDGNVRGTLDGVTAFRLGMFATGTFVVRGDVVDGHVGFDPITRLPNGSGEPVTSAIVAEDYVGMGENTPRVLRVDSAIFSRTSNWRGLGGIGDHPIGGPGPLDLDIDGLVGETPVNNDPVPGEGWDELNITDQTWVLNTGGPIITRTTGDAYPWTAGPVVAGATGPTRRERYNLAYEQYPPACFPVPINVWVDVSWTEIFDSRSDLASLLPN